MLSALLMGVHSSEALALSFSDFSILAENNVTIGEASVIDGNTGSNTGNVDVGPSAILASIFSGGTVQSIGASAIVTGKIVSNGVTNLNSSAIVNDTVDSGGNTTLGPGVNILSNLTSSGTTQIDSNALVGGNVLSDSDLTLDPDSLIQGNAGVNGNVTVNHGASIVGHVTHSGSLTLNGTGSVGSSSVGVSVVNPESFAGAVFPTTNIFTAGGSNITTAAGETTTLAPGTYGTLDLADNNTLNLSSGSYFFDVIDINGNLDFNLNLAGGNLLLHVLGDADFGQNLDVFLANGDAFNIYLETHGNWEAQGTWHGTVFAPFGDITLGQNSIAFGAFYSGDQIDIGQDTNLIFQLSNSATTTIIPEPSTLFLLGITFLSSAFLKSFRKI